MWYYYTRFPNVTKYSQGCLGHRDSEDTGQAEPHLETRVTFLVRHKIEFLQGSPSRCTGIPGLNFSKKCVFRGSLVAHWPMFSGSQSRSSSLVLSLSLLPAFCSQWKHCAAALLLFTSSNANLGCILPFQCQQPVLLLQSPLAFEE